jgi:hypothetical protein
VGKLVNQQVSSPGHIGPSSGGRKYKNVGNQSSNNRSKFCSYRYHYLALFVHYLVLIFFKIKAQIYSLFLIMKAFFLLERRIMQRILRDIG